MPEELEVARCGAVHPRKPARCTLPPDHGPVLVGSLPFDHVDTDLELAWRLT